MRFSQIYCYPCKVFNFLPLSQLNWTFTPVEIIYMATQHLCKNQYFFFIINNRNDLITIEQFLTIDFLYVQIQGFTSWSLGCEKGLFTSLICYPSLKMLAERLSRNTNLDFRCQPLVENRAQTHFCGIQRFTRSDVPSRAHWSLCSHSSYTLTPSCACFGTSASSFLYETGRLFTGSLLGWNFPCFAIPWSPAFILLHLRANCL